MTRVAVCDDQALLRGSLSLLIDNEPDLTVVGEAGTGAEAVTLATRETPDVMLMDVRMPAMDGIEATRRICSDTGLSSVRILILTTFDLDEYVFSSLRAGASGFLLKDTPPAEMLTAIRTIAGGDELLAPAVTRRLIDRFVRDEAGRASSGPGGSAAWHRSSGRISADRAERLAGITDRERDVLELIARGLSNQEITERLYLSMATVKTHIGRLLTKLGARDRAQLVIAAYEGGLVRPGGADGGRALS